MRSAVCEALEQRRLLATWVIDGNASANDFRVELENGNLVLYSDDTAVQSHSVGTYDDIQMNGYGANDTLKISAAANGGDDIDFQGGAGNDTMYGGEGDDVATGEGEDDDIYGGPGRDSIDGFEGNDFISGGDGVDTLYGGSGNDDVLGSYDLGYDYLADTLRG